MQSTAQKLKEWNQKWQAGLKADTKAGSQLADAVLDLVTILQMPNETPPKKTKKDES